MSLRFESQCALQALNTLALPSRASVALLRDEAQLAAWCAQRLRDGGPWGRQSPVFVLGGGSNVVLAPTLRHAVVRPLLRGISLYAATARHWIVEAGAGECWHDLVVHCLRQGWPGLENLALIPGTVGAAPVQNIGAYGVELAERLHSVVAWDLERGERYELGPEDCEFSYRDSRFKRAGPGRWLIVRVRLALPRHWVPQLAYGDLQNLQAPVTPLQVFAAVCRIRRRKLPDPARLPNAGSFFKNPVVPGAVANALQAHWPGLRAYPAPDGGVKLAAGWLIEQVGWKGRRLGPVGMHARQALVLVNHGGAQLNDVMALQHAVQDAVFARFGVCLEREPVLVD